MLLVNRTTLEIALMTKLKKYVENNPIFVILFVLFLFLEVFSVNHRFFISNFHFLNKYEYNIEDGVLYGFIEENGTLISEHNDPNITFRFIDDRVRYITIYCTNPNRDSVSQVFYRRENQDWSEDNSVTFTIFEPETTITLPRTINVTSLRFDLTDREGDSVICQGFTINPDMPYKLGFFRLVLYIFCLLGLFFGHKIIPPTLSNNILQLVINNSIWVLLLLLYFINISYPVTITFDSAHYLWLADLIKQGNWALWDPIRLLGFPLNIFFSLSVFGYSQDALLIPMILAHLLLFIFCYQIGLEVLKPYNKTFRFSIIIAIYLFIVLDPTVVGYFHTLMTEYLAAMIAAISCFVALRLFSAPLFSKRFYFLSTYFLLMAPISWHLKQPYIGAALFPFLIVIFLIILRKFSWKLLVYGLIVNSLIMVLVLSSTFAWNSFLESQGNPMKENRQLSTYAEQSISNKIGDAKNNPLDMINRQIAHYLASTNFRRRTSSGEMGEINLTKGFQNSMIAHRMFLNPGQSNIYYLFPFYDPYTLGFKDFYSPPIWINHLFQSRVTLSNFLFISSYLILPFYLIVVLILWLRNKNLVNTALLILGGTSFLNTIAHLLLHPIDRYLFMGYPLNLLIIVILIIKGLQYLVPSGLDLRSSN